MRDKQHMLSYLPFAALGLPGWMGLDKSAAIAIVIGCILLTTALATAYKLYHCRRNRDLRNDEMRTANTGQYHGMYSNVYKCIGTTLNLFKECNGKQF